MKNNKTGHVSVNVIPRCIHVTTAALGKAISITFCVCVCSLGYPSCNEHALYYIVICGLSSSTIFSTLSLFTCMIFGKTSFKIKCAVKSPNCQVVSALRLILSRTWIFLVFHTFLGHPVHNIYWNTCITKPLLQTETSTDIHSLCPNLGCMGLDERLSCSHWWTDLPNGRQEWLHLLDHRVVS